MPSSNNFHSEQEYNELVERVAKYIADKAKSDRREAWFIEYHFHRDVLSLLKTFDDYKPEVW